MIFDCRRRRLERIRRERAYWRKVRELRERQAQAHVSLGPRTLIPANGKTSFLYHP